eukprot:NODE_334_length_10694_cov_0.301180.p4 type:complete len:343 gc:universal NODE_334_length_10694_cov_0.301180:4270-3242(-)
MRHSDFKLPKKIRNPFPDIIKYELNKSRELTQILDKFSNAQSSKTDIPVNTNVVSYSPLFYSYQSKIIQRSVDALQSFIDLFPLNRLLMPPVEICKTDFQKIGLPKNVCAFVGYSHNSLSKSSDIAMNFPTIVDRIEIPKDEMKRFYMGTWLADDCINGFLYLLTKRYTNLHCYNTNFYTFLLQNYSRVKRHTKKVNIFIKHILAIPIHHPGHWALAIVLIKHKKIIYIDSMGNYKGQQVLRDIKNYLINECKDKPHLEGKAFLSHIDKVELINLSNNPQQENGNDCGMFAIMGAKSFAVHYSTIKKEDNAAELCRILTFNQQEMNYWRARVCSELFKAELM